jgi:hypothetical protein
MKAIKSIGMSERVRIKVYEKKMRIRRTQSNGYMNMNKTSYNLKMMLE